MDLPKDFHYMLYRAPSIRYYDTSYVINKKWQRGGEELTFPVVHSFVNSDAKIRGYVPDTPDSNVHHQADHYMTDSETDKVQRHRNNHRDRPRRRTRSLEKRTKRPLSTALEIHTTSDEDDDDDDEDDVDGDIQSVKSVIEKKLTTKESQNSNNNNNIPKIVDNNVSSNNNNNNNNKKKSSVEDQCETKGAINLDESRLSTKSYSSNDKNNNNKTTIIVSYQTVTSNENLSLINNETENDDLVTKNKAFEEPNDTSSPIPEIQVREPSDDSDVKRNSEHSSVTTTTDEQQINIQSIVVADVHTRPISIASSTISSDALVIKENSSDEEDLEYDLTKEIQQVPEFFKHRGSKSLITIQETDSVNQFEGSVSDQEDIDRRRNRISSNASDYDSDRTLMSDVSSPQNIKPISLGGRKYFYIPGTTPSCTSPSWLSTSRSTINDGDADYSMSDYEIVDIRRRNSATSPIRSQTRHHSLQKSYTDNDIRLDQNNIPKSQSFPIQSKRHHYQSNPNIADNLRLHYVTQRILASILPARDRNIEEDVLLQGPHMEGQLQDEYEKEVIMMLEQKHGKNYRVFDLESCISVITLERICELCKRIDKWLGSGQEKVVVLQDRENRQRLGATIAAYLEYLDICASSFASTTPRSNSRNSNRGSHGSSSANEDLRAQNAINKNWLDLDIFSMKKFLEDFIGPLRIPSHRRYIQYFSGLLSGKVRINSAALNLKCISIESPPSWLQYNGISSESEWNSFIKIYEGLRCIYTSDIHIIPITTRQFLYQTGNLQLRGDILIRCYQIVPSTTSCNNNNNVIYNGGPESNDCRELLFSLQFHTCAMDSKEVVFRKDDLDYAWCDHRFPKDCKVTFHFNRGANHSDNNYIFQSPLIRTEPPNILAKADSIEDFDLSSKYQGPLDGSLYATILKSPKTNSSQYASQVTSNRTSTSSVHLIQPPPQFSSNPRQQYEIIEASRPISTSTPIRDRGRTVEPPIRTSSLHIRDTQSQPRSTSDYSYIDSSRPGTSQSNYRTSTGQNHHQKHHTQQITTVESYHQNTSSNNNSNHQHNLKPIQSGPNYSQQHQHHNGTSSSTTTQREYVRSPLTLSMDSGISSNGVLNRPQQGSSVSPISFPSQPSPQEDRHRELDEILSDMLMTVQDIPDFGKNKTQKHHPSTITKTTQIQRQIRSQSALPIHHSTSQVIVIPSDLNNYQQQQQQQLKRSLSYNTYVNEPLISHQNPNQSAYLTKERLELYGDTSSTATTLTPPPSENGGRDTPTTITSNIISATSTTGSIPAINTHHHHNTQQHHQQSINSYQQQQQQQQQQQEIYRERRETYNSMASTSSQQSSLYRQQDRTYQQQQQQQQNYNNQQNNINSVSEDEDNIPYHAREHSQPFSYGSVPNNHKLTEIPLSNNNNNGIDPDLDAELIDPKMIKAQSGLSSPSLVRKFAGDINSPQQTNGYAVVGGGGDNRGTFSSSTTTTSSSTLRKTPIRNDFEDMLRERREKVMSEKYSTMNNSSSSDRNQLPSKVNDNNKWLHTQVNQTNGYHYYNEPLKRSNTLDGFHRSNSTDGLSGQTWLQLQQQKLRAKKTQQLRDERKYFEDIHAEIRNRPQKTRVVRYDGYASDTAAFGDEVDYRRPLHIQTPYNASRSPERKYNTMTTTTTTVTKERPFVTVKRAHEQAKRETVGVREESFSSYRSETDPELSNAGSPRPETPAFPTTPRTPYGFTNGSVSPALPPKSPTSQRKDLYAQRGGQQDIINQNEMYSTYGTRRNSNSSNANSEPQEVAAHHVKFVRDSSKYWYKATLSRDEAISILRHAMPGTFLVRDSTTYKNAFGLVLRVAYPPPGVTLKPGGDELVRHFLIEPTNRGVRLKGCANEPTFTSLSALIYQHSITPLALPCRLILPERDIAPSDVQSPEQKQLITQGAACNILYLYACETESLTGEEAVRRAISELYSLKPLPLSTEVHFKVSQQGITLTDNNRQKFFRKHYSSNVVSFCGFDPDRRTWSVKSEGDFPVQNKTIFAFVARRSASSADNQCHVFCDLAPNQPASAIVSFVNKVLPTEKLINSNI